MLENDTCAELEPMLHAVAERFVALGMPEALLAISAPEPLFRAYI